LLSPPIVDCMFFEKLNSRIRILIRFPAPKQVQISQKIICNFTAKSPVTQLHPPQNEFRYGISVKNWSSEHTFTLLTAQYQVYCNQSRPCTSKHQKTTHASLY
jgi:hypothetical protein